ncbi:MAG: hypothetical protein QOG64_1792 [Acidimicrobiaceae bacterium]|nr:hypothetical protein [Acidimicrobiaceae bacterium]
MVLAPFGDGSVGLGLYLHDLPADEAVERLVAQAVAAERVGFDGVSIAEHHAGYRSYLPNPLLASAWMLAATKRVWCGPLPLLLPLRNPGLLAEDLAWLDARYPDRVGAGLAAGYNAEDFTAVGSRNFATRGKAYGRRLRTVARLLRGDANGLIARDHAVTWRGRRSFPLVGAAGGRAAARRAAEAGVGVMMDSMAPVETLAVVAEEYRAAGGVGPRVLCRRVWVGDPPRDLFAAQLAGYQSHAESGSWLQGVGVNALISGSPAAIADRLVAEGRAATASAFALRVHISGLDPGAAEEQIHLVGEQVLPPLREALVRRR